ncbi:MAG: ArsR/SmtB family transcription factor [Candidatus Limnocylindrales bacterium]
MATRPTTTSRRAEAGSGGRAQVRGMTSGAVPYSIEFDGRTVYDFLISLGVHDAHEHDLQPDDRRWLTAALAALPTDRRADVEACFGDSPKAFCQAAGALVVLDPEARSARQFVAALAVMDTGEIVRAMLASYTRETQAAEHLERILGGADEDIAAFVAGVDEYHQEAIADFLAAPSAWVDRIRGLLGAWLPKFEEIEPRLQRMIQRDLELRAEDRQRLPAAEVVERATSGLRFFGETGINRLILSPSYFSRPFNYVYEGRDWRLFCYPIADSALDLGDETAPPAALVRLHRALGDESRLRILHLLREKDLYLTELAQLLEVSKPTAKHHLAQLRAAGLVTMTDQGSMTYYSLRRDRIEQADDEIRRYLA